MIELEKYLKYGMCCCSKVGAIFLQTKSSNIQMKTPQSYPFVWIGPLQDFISFQSLTSSRNPRLASLSEFKYLRNENVSWSKDDNDM